MKILMVGATGKFAGLVVPALKKRGAVVRALVRSADKAGDAYRHGSDEIAIGDLGNEQSLREATNGVDGVFHINPAFAPNEAELGVSMVHAAMASNVRKFVFSGAIHPSISKMVNHAAKRPVEEALYESGMVFTILQPTMFMQTLANSWKEAVEHGSLSFPYSLHARVCYVDYRDVAEAAAIGLTTDRLNHGTFELSAPGMVDRVQMAEIMSQALGRAIEPRQPSFDEWSRMAQIPIGPVRDGLRAMYADYDRYGFPGGNALVLRAILEREPRTLEEYVGELAKSV